MNPKLSITNGIIVLPDQAIHGTDLYISADRIMGMGPRGQVEHSIDAHGGYVIPGLIDIHYHGTMLIPEADKIKDALARDAMRLAKQGVTSFLPTLASATIPAWLACLAALDEALADPPPGAKPLGVHLEGVFLNPQARGAHPKELIKNYDISNPDHAAIFKNYAQIIRMVTFAPEMPGGQDLIRTCKDKGIIGAIGHSRATPEQVREFANQGLCHITHLFNGMSGIHHRAPGLALAGLILDEVTADVICDGAHVSPDVIRLIFGIRNPDDIILISDYVGIGDLDSEEPNYLPGGLLAGSHLRLCRAIKNVMEFTGIDLPAAVRMASLNPAKLLGMENNLGSLEPGKLADICITDQDLNVRQVIKAGSEVSF